MYNARVFLVIDQPDLQDGPVPGRTDIHEHLAVTLGGHDLDRMPHGVQDVLCGDPVLPRTWEHPHRKQD
jgi:hypothetical protein